MKLIIGSHDYSDFIQESSYKVDETNVFAEWEDANYTSHKQKLRTKISGGFEMVFVKEADAIAFINDLNNTDENGTITAEISVSNRNEDRTINCFMAIVTKRIAKISSDYTYQRYEITIEER